MMRVLDSGVQDSCNAYPAGDGFMLHGPILAALTDTHLYFADKFLKLDIDTFGKSPVL